jgi:hypothetical protein
VTGDDFQIGIQKLLPLPYTSTGHEGRKVMRLAGDWNLHIDGGYQIDIVRGEAVVVVSKEGRPHRSPHQNRSSLSSVCVDVASIPSPGCSLAVSDCSDSQSGCRGKKIKEEDISGGLQATRVRR